MTRALTTQHLSPEAIAQLLNYLPDYIKAALLEPICRCESRLRLGSLCTLQVGADFSKVI